VRRGGLGDRLFFGRSVAPFWTKLKCLDVSGPILATLVVVLR